VDLIAVHSAFAWHGVLWAHKSAPKSVLNPTKMLMGLRHIFDQQRSDDAVATLPKAWRCDCNLPTSAI